MDGQLHSTDSAYLSMDLSQEGKAGSELLQSAEEEARKSKIVLTDIVGAVPAYLTPAMANWFQLQIMANRRAALDEIDAKFGEAEHTVHGEPLFYERRRNEAEDKRVRDKREALANCREQNKVLFEKIDSSKSDLAVKNSRFETLRNKHKREPKSPKAILYLIGILLIALAELAINYESFLAIEYFSQAIALGTSLVVAAAIAGSAHGFGTMMCQFRYRFDPARRDDEISSGWMMLSLSLTALSIALAAVWWGRVIYFDELMREVLVTGGSAASPMRVIGGSMLGNVLVWILGVLLAYFTHDPDPNFPARAEELRKEEKQYNALKKRAEKETQRAFQQADAALENQLEDITSRNESMSSIPEHKEAREMLRLVQAQDQKVLGLLMNYREALVQRLGDKSVLQKPLERSDENAKISREEYSALALQMKYL